MEISCSRNLGFDNIAANFTFFGEKASDLIGSVCQFYSLLSQSCIGNTFQEFLEFLTIGVVICVSGLDCTRLL
jgi:hypothetical protein